MGFLDIIFKDRLIDGRKKPTVRSRQNKNALYKGIAKLRGGSYGPNRSKK